MNNFEQGSIVLVDFTYSNQQQSKLRPALVVSNSEYNRISRDIVVMKITSREPKLWSVCIGNEDLLAGSLDYISYVQTDSLYSLEKTIIVDSIGILAPDKNERYQKPDFGSFCADEKVVNESDDGMTGPPGLSGQDQKTYLDFWSDEFGESEV